MHAHPAFGEALRNPNALKSAENPATRHPSPKWRRCCAVPLFLLVALLPLRSYAMQPDNITQAEMSLIPPYCKDANTFGYGGTADNMSPNAPKWVALMGTGFWAIHHYCWALITLIRVQKPTTPAMIRLGARKEALGDLGFVVAHSPHDFVMLPEIYTKAGQVELDLDKPRDAEASFAKARALKPDYWPAYFHWAEYLKASGHKAQAKALVEEGLSYSPDAKALQGLFKALGGDPKSVPSRNAGVAATGASSAANESTSTSDRGRRSAKSAD
jgi:tetratricopeptide (TPR) repeat protein